ncbi:helix-turn-helix domain-containing protein [Actinomycetospora sp.]|uniref:helix-turn-helix domain-containing protein n=1 Tax=Actinomycetospora sp. TaxID=1872135 RepID=UPI002F3FEDBE
MGEVISLESRRRSAVPPEAGPPDAVPRRTSPEPWPASPAPGPTEPLWREVVGRRLRDLRRARGERLADTAARAGMSPQYLSELERGRKDPSSEILAAAAGALGVPLREIVRLAHADLARGAGSRGSVRLAA